MGKIIRLTESQLVGLVKKIITEQSTPNNRDIKTYPPCVQAFGNPINYYGDYWGVYGKNGIKSYDWNGYWFFNNYSVIGPNNTRGQYFCKGDQPTLGTKVGPSKGGKTTTAELAGGVLKVNGKISGDAVKRVQNRVIQGKHGDATTVGGNAKCGTDWQTCSGIYNQATAEAVKKFQKSAGITADGVVGDETWQQLFGGSGPAKWTPPKSTEYDQMTKKYGKGFK